MILKDLVDYGLTEREAKTYLALLELEIGSAQEIANKSGVNRSTTYVTLESLKKSGLVSIADSETVRHYVATPPEAILRSAEDMAVNQQNILRKIQTILPDMKALYKGTKKKPSIKVFEGKAGLISAFEDTLNTHEKLIRVTSAVGNLGRIIPTYLAEYIQKRFKSGIRMQGIHPNDEATKNLIMISPKNFDTPVLIPMEKYKFPADMAIYDNKIGYMSHENGGVAIIIESTEMSDVMKSIFDLAWKEAKRLNDNLVETENTSTKITTKINHKKDKKKK
jgi:sugar-specific transcriptional regulator TrmB